MKKILKMTLILGLAVSLLLPSCSLAANAKRYVQTENGKSLNVRDLPGKNGSVIFRLKNGSRVTVLEELEDWVQIEADEGTGYVQAAFLMEKKPVSLHEKHFVTMADGTSFTLSNELVHIIKDVTNIEGLGWQLQGNIIGLTFNLLDEKGQPVARVEKSAISVHDKYSMGIYQPDKEQIVVAIVIQLEKMIEARNENRD